MTDGWRRLGQEIAKARDRKRWSTQQLADVMEMSVTTVENLEAGKRSNYRPTTIRRLEDALGWDPDSVAGVLAGDAPRPVLDSTLARIHDAWAELSDDQRLAVAHYAEMFIIRQR